MEDFIVGDVIKFWSLSGQFRAGKEELLLPAGYRLLADMRSLRIGVVRWMPGYEEERVERAVMGFVRDGFHLPDRASLGDNNPSQWPFPDRDPWRLLSLLGMIHPETKQRFTYMAVSGAESVAIGELCGLYGRHASQRGCEADIPIVRLKAVRNVGVHRPRFLIDGWASRTNVAA